MIRAGDALLGRLGRKPNTLVLQETSAAIRARLPACLCMIGFVRLLVLAATHRLICQCQWHRPCALAVLLSSTSTGATLLRGKLRLAGRTCSILLAIFWSG